LEITKGERNPVLIQQKINEALAGPITFRYATQVEVGNAKLVYTIFYTNAPSNKKKKIKAAVFRTNRAKELPDMVDAWYSKNKDSEVKLCSQSAIGNTTVTTMFYEK